MCTFPAQETTASGTFWRHGDVHVPCTGEDCVRSLLEPLGCAHSLHRRQLRQESSGASGTCTFPAQESTASGAFWSHRDVNQEACTRRPPQKGPRTAGGTGHPADRPLVTPRGRGRVITS